MRSPCPAHLGLQHETVVPLTVYGGPVDSPGQVLDSGERREVRLTVGSSAHLDGFPAVESGPGPLLVLISPAQISLNSSGLLVLGSLEAGLGLHVVREGEVVDNLLELGLTDVGREPA